MNRGGIVVAGEEAEDEEEIYPTQPNVIIHSLLINNLKYLRF